MLARSELLGQTAYYEAIGQGHHYTEDQSRGSTEVLDHAGSNS